MKKKTLALGLVLVLLLGVTLPWALALHGQREDVAVTSVTTLGDPMEAQGLTVRQTSSYERRLVWDLSIPAHDPASAETDFSYHHDILQFPFQGTGIHIHSPINGTYFFDGVQEFSFILEHNAELRCLEPLLREALDNTDPGHRSVTEIRPADYLEVYPLAAEPNIGSYLHAETLDTTLQDFFSFPIDPETVWTIGVRKEDDGAPGEISFNEGNDFFSPNTVSVYSDSRLFFTFDRWSLPQPMDFSNTPGGFGLYAMDLVQRDDYAEALPGTLANVHPLPPEAVVLDLSWTHDRSALLLTWCLGETYTCEVLDPETLAVLQSFPIPAEPPSLADYTYYDDQGREVWGQEMRWDMDDVLAEETCLIFRGAGTFHLFAREGGRYDYRFSAPAEDLMVVYPYAEYLTAAWDGERLALASLGDPYLTSQILLWVYRGGELVYQGTYTTSLSDLASDQARETEDYYLPIQILDKGALSLTWN